MKGINKMEEKEREREKEQEKAKKELQYIANNYRLLEKSIASQLEMLAEHDTTTGSNREYIWMDLFKQIIPQKFSIERSVFILDSTGKRSREVDLAIFDEQYTPYIFRHGKLKYIPIEAVAVVVECKSKSPDKDSLETWCDSINQLRTSANSIARLVGNIHHLDTTPLNSNSGKQPSRSSTQTGTRPIKILCSMEKSEPGKHVEEGMFDFVLQEQNDALTLFKPANSHLSDWYQTLNHQTARGWPDKIKEFTYPDVESANPELEKFEIKDKEGKTNTILSLVFILNQLLMLINNPLFFPHLSYVKLFNDVEQGLFDESGEE